MIPTWQRLEKVNTTLQSILTPRTQINRTVSTIKTNNTNILGKGSEKNKNEWKSTSLQLLHCLWILKCANLQLFHVFELCKILDNKGDKV